MLYHRTGVVMQTKAGTALSLISLALGAVLALAVNAESGGFTVGWILMELGVAGLLLVVLIGTADDGFAYEQAPSSPEPAIGEDRRSVGSRDALRDAA